MPGNRHEQGQAWSRIAAILPVFLIVPPALSPNYTLQNAGALITLLARLLPRMSVGIYSVTSAFAAYQRWYLRTTAERNQNGR
jgi:hypothetical protein